MTTGFGFWEVLALVGVIQGFFLALVLWTQARGNRPANRILAALVGLYSLHLLHIVLYWTRGIVSVPHFWGVTWFFPYLYGAASYLYVRTLGDPDLPLRRRDTAHALPFALAVLLFSRFYASSADTKRRLLEASYESSSGAPHPLVLAVWGLQFVHFGCYLVASFRRLRGASDELQSHWLRRLLVAFAVSFACWFLYGMSLSFGVAYSRDIDYAATLAMTVSIYAVGYTALRVPELFVGALGLPRERGRGRGRGKYEGSVLTDALIAEYRDRLVAVMESTRPHIDATLRLPDLASLVDVPPHQLSQVLNQGFGVRFNDFVNRYRVEEAKRLLSDPARRDESLLSLAFEAGFNNKTSFNQAFKKYARMTPSRFRDEA